MEKILTVSIAGYNVEQYIEQALAPFAKEEFSGLIEVFIIDDGGSDNTYAIAETYAMNYPEIFFPVHKENGGWGSTVNYGIEHAHGKYFKQLDGDDFYNPDNISAFLNELETCDADLVYTPFTSFEDETNKIISRTKQIEGLEIGVTYFYENVADRVPLAMHSCTFRTSMLKDNNIHITEKCFYTDVEFVVKAVSHVKTVMLSSYDLYQYRIAREGQSMSYAGVKKHYKEHLTVTKELIAFIDNNYLPGKVSNAIGERISYLISNQYSIFYILRPSSLHKKELKKYDNFIKDNANNYYNDVPLYIKIERKLNFYGYSFFVGLRYINHLIKVKTRGY